jgi:hypothetical protein
MEFIGCFILVVGVCINNVLTLRVCSKVSKYGLDKTNCCQWQGLFLSHAETAVCSTRLRMCT